MTSDVERRVAQHYARRDLEQTIMQAAANYALHELEHSKDPAPEAAVRELGLSAN